jgi:large repetitive protein
VSTTAPSGVRGRTGAVAVVLLVLAALLLPATAASAAVPTAPAAPTVTPANGALLVEWVAPADGGLPILDYTVEAYATGTTTGPLAAVVTGPAARFAVLSGLTNATAVDVRVTARNADGPSALGAVTVGTPAVVSAPGAPTATLAVGGDATSLVASWTGSGSTATGWVAMLRSGGTIVRTAATSAGQTTTTFTGLTTGTSYTVVVVATDSDAAGPVSAASAAVVAGAPGPTPAPVPTRGSAILLVEWTAPTTGGAPTGYLVQVIRDSDDSVQASATTGPNARAAVLSGCTSGSGVCNGTTYVVTVTASNAHGSAVSPESVGVLPSTGTGRPNAATAVVATPGSSSGTVSVTWSPPSGGTSPTRYVVVGSTTTQVVGESDTAPPHTISGLVDGTPHTFRVIGVAAAGVGPLSDASAPVVPGTPGTPTGLVATPGDADVHLAWGAPSFGVTPTGYTVRTTPQGGSLLSDVCIGTVPGRTGCVAAATAITVTGLTNGVTYDFEVRAATAAGAGATSAIVSATPFGRPIAPAPAMAVAGNGEILVTWTTPPSDGGNAIDGYRVDVLDAGVVASTVDVAAGATSTLFSGLTNGTAYTVEVVAINDRGESDPAVAGPVTPSASQPSRPTAVVVEPGDTQALVSWTAPSATGGTAIATYTVSAVRSGSPTVTATVPGTVRVALLTGLVNGAPGYEFTVHATNATLSGLASSPAVSATPGPGGTRPGTPTAVTAQAGTTAGALIISWTAAAQADAYAVIVSAGGSVVAATTVTGTTATVTGLTDGTTYSVIVVAVNNGGGSGPPSAAVTAIPGPPQPPTAPIATLPDPGAATLSWTAPASGGSVSGYLVEARQGGTLVATLCLGAWDDEPAGGCSALGTTISIPLTDGQTYTLQVAAANDAGLSTFASVTGVVPYRAPNAPMLVIAAPGSGQAVVTWFAPLVDGGRPITGYEVRARPASGPVVGPVVTSDTARAAIITGLTNGTSYTIEVQAENLRGEGTAGTSVITPRTVPGAPGRPSGATDGDSCVPSTQGRDCDVDLTWAAPANTGGAPITRYDVFAYPVDDPDDTTVVCVNATGADGCAVDADLSTPGMAVPALREARQYRFTVAARNVAGAGPQSENSAPVTVGNIPTFPGAPTITAVTPGDHQVIVTWTAPAFEGGCPNGIDNYVVEADDGLQLTQVTGADRTAAVSGLTNGVSYSFTVYARNCVGSGVDSNAMSATPVAGPGAPEAVVATAGPGPGAVTVRWNEPDSGGSTLDFFIVTTSPAHVAPVRVEQFSLSATITGLSNGVTYTFSVTATNDAGVISPPSAPSNAVTPRTTPGAPTDVIGVPSDREVLVSWVAPPDGGSEILGYRITSSRGDEVTTDGQETAAYVTGLQNGLSYTFTVSARNEGGEGAPSAPSAPVTPGPPPVTPGSPSRVTATAGANSIAVRFLAPDDGGSPITSFLVVARDASGAVVGQGTGTTSPVTVDGLTNGVPVTATVEAVNGLGRGAPSVPSAPVIPEAPAIGAPPRLGAGIIGMGLSAEGSGYWLGAANGGVAAYGSARPLGGVANQALARPIVGMAPTPTGQGYWLVASDGGIFSFGDAAFHGSTGGITLNRPIVGMAPTPSGRGYWLVASDGGIFAYGDAGFFGSTGAIALNKPIVGMTPTPTGQGYWLVATDGGIFAFGDAGFFGSTGAITLNQPIVGMAPTRAGYWMVASDGGIFAFGDAAFVGAGGAGFLPIVDMVGTTSGRGYWLVDSGGVVTAYGDAKRG